MRVLVTGAEGLLGREVVRAFAGNAVTAAGREAFDVTRIDETIEAVRDAEPELIVHCAAWSDVNGAESNEVEAFRVNAIGAKNVALAANEVGARILHVSTDYVFDGTLLRPYIESDLVNPTGVYGRSKWMGERMVRDVVDRWTVVRTQALYGRTGRSFFKAIVAQVEQGNALTVVDDQTVCPTRAADLAAALVRIATEGSPGLYHASSNGECTWFDFAREILVQIGRPDHPLTPVKTERKEGVSPRPPYSVLRNFHLELTIGDTLPHWRDALATHLTEA